MLPDTLVVALPDRTKREVESSSDQVRKSTIRTNKRRHIKMTVSVDYSCCKKCSEASRCFLNDMNFEIEELKGKCELLDGNNGWC